MFVNTLRIVSASAKINCFFFVCEYTKCSAFSFESLSDLLFRSVHGIVGIPDLYGISYESGLYVREVFIESMEDDVEFVICRTVESFNFNSFGGLASVTDVSEPGLCRKALVFHSCAPLNFSGFILIHFSYISQVWDIMCV